MKIKQQQHQKPNKCSEIEMYTKCVAYKKTNALNYYVKIEY